MKEIEFNKYFNPFQNVNVSQLTKFKILTLIKTLMTYYLKK